MRRIGATSKLDGVFRCVVRLTSSCSLAEKCSPLTNLPTRRMAGASRLLPAPRIECLAASWRSANVAELGVTSSAVRVRSGTNRIVQVPGCVGRAVLMDCIQKGALAKAPFVMITTSLSARGDGGTRLAMNERTRKGSFACPFACDHAHEPMCMWAGRASMRACHSHCGLLWASRHRHERSQSTVVDTERISEGLVTL